MRQIMIPQERVHEICNLYFKTKALMLRAEEADNNNETFLQPSLELKAAFDHVMRALARDSGFTKNGDQEPDRYTDRQLDKAIGHIYRAYFDTADWISINFREQFSSLLEPYDNADIATVFPLYYKEIKPRFIDYETGITSLRNQKDIAGESETLFEKYDALLDRMDEDLKVISRMVPSLNEHQEKRLRAEKRNWFLSLATDGLKYIIGAVIGGLLAAIGLKTK